MTESIELIELDELDLDGGCVFVRSLLCFIYKKRHLYAMKDFLYVQNKNPDGARVSFKGGFYFVRTMSSNDSTN